MEHFDPFHLFLWDPIAFEGTWYEINRVTILMFLAASLCIGFFVLGARRKALVPHGLQTVAEAAYLFVRNNIAIDVIGPEGVKYANYLTTLFFFIFFSNVLEIVPGINFPVTARMGIPAFLALVTYVVYNVVGFKKQGLGYLKGVLFPPGVPKPVYILLTPIEFFSVFLIRPATLAIRLLANMMAGNVLLTIFFLFTADFAAAAIRPSLSGILTPITFIVACGLMVFEMLVIAIQAYIFTMLTAFYIAESIHGHGDEHHDEAIKAELAEPQQRGQVEELAAVHG